MFGFITAKNAASSQELLEQIVQLIQVSITSRTVVCNATASVGHCLATLRAKHPVDRCCALATNGRACPCSIKTIFTRCKLCQQIVIAATSYCIRPTLKWFWTW
jgi:hypothetical protein